MLVSRILRSLRGNGAYAPSGAPSLHSPVSQACTHAQMREPAYAYWCEVIKEPVRTHRKQWEFCYILQSLARSGKLAPGMRGLGFGVGGEPLTAVFAERGVQVVATDLDFEGAQALGWVDTQQHAATKSGLNERKICPEEKFKENVEFRNVDMNSIPAEFAGQFDFSWSACALEHLGSIKNGLRFVEKSVECLVPGGVAVHTTEFNCNSDTETLDNMGTVLFRKCDFLSLAERLAAKGAQLQLCFDLGDLPLDKHIDVPPYSANEHLKLQIDRWVTTSFGLIVRKSSKA